ncbi:hypothetical protein TRVL_07415 [Trypanosoma vivax]|nr:hypothetical protein TRVL_07415 [Trypanosoma vivax]
MPLATYGNSSASWLLILMQKSVTSPRSCWSATLSYHLQVKLLASGTKAAMCFPCWEIGRPERVGLDMAMAVTPSRSNAPYRAAYKSQHQGISLSKPDANCFQASVFRKCATRVFRISESEL